MAKKKTANISTDLTDKVLFLLEGAQQNGTGRTARCPAHDDTQNSLSIARGDDGRVLLHCFAGCSVEEIVEALGLEMRDLFPEDGRRPPGNGRPNGRSRLTVADLARDKNLPEAFLRELGVVEAGSALRIIYRLADGTTAPRQRIRTALAAKDGSFGRRVRAELSPTACGGWRKPV